MKNIIRFLALAGVAAAFASCNKAEYVDDNFISLSSNRFTILENGDVLKVPVYLYGEADECVVTYSVTEGTAREGVNYEVVDSKGNPDQSGVLVVSNTDENAANAIYLKIKDRSGQEDGHLKFRIDIKNTSEEGIFIGAFNSCECTIVDIDSGLPKFIGNYTGKGKDMDNENVVFDFTLENYTPGADAKYPEANCMFTNGVMEFENGNQMEFAEPVYAYFDLNMLQFKVYGLQPFNTYNFQGLGAADVAWGAASGSGDSGFIINAGEGSLDLANDLMLFLLDPETGKNTNSYAGTLAAGYKWTKTN